MPFHSGKRRADLVDVAPEALQIQAEAAFFQDNQCLMASELEGANDAVGCLRKGLTDLVIQTHAVSAKLKIWRDSDELDPTTRSEINGMMKMNYEFYSSLLALQTNERMEIDDLRPDESENSLSSLILRASISEACKSSALSDKSDESGGCSSSSTPEQLVERHRRQLHMLLRDTPVQRMIDDQTLHQQIAGREMRGTTVERMLRENETRRPESIPGDEATMESQAATSEIPEDGWDGEPLSSIAAVMTAIVTLRQNERVASRDSVKALAIRLGAADNRTLDSYVAPECKKDSHGIGVYEEGNYDLRTTPEKLINVSNLAKQVARNEGISAWLQTLPMNETTESVQPPPPPPPPLSSSEPPPAPPPLVSEVSNSICNICLGPILSLSGCVKLPCGHVFKQECIEAWINKCKEQGRVAAMCPMRCCAITSLTSLNSDGSTLQCIHIPAIVEEFSDGMDTPHIGVVARNSLSRAIRQLQCNLLETAPQHASRRRSL